MEVKEIPFAHLLSNVVDNRGKTCPTSDVGIPLIATNCIRNDILYPVYEKVRFVSQETYNTWFRGHPEPGDLIFVTKGTPGRVCIAPDPVDFCIAQDMVAIRADKEKVYPRYLFAVLRSPEIQRRIENMHVGTLIPHFKKGDFDKLFIPVSDPKTQEIIGDVYFTLSYKIELNQQMNHTLEAIARALFKSWFINFDPVRAKMDGRQPAGMDAETAALFPAEFEDSPLGKIPKGWKVQKLIEITSKIGSGATPRGGSQVYVDEGVSLIRSQNVYDYRFSWDGLARITEETAEQLRNVTVEPNDILLNITGDSILRTCVVEQAVLPARVNQHVVIIRALPEIPCYYLHFCLVQPQMKNLLLGFDTGGTRKAVTKGQLESVPILVPSESILLVFKKLTAPMFERINSNLMESRKLVETRDSLLPKLLSGQVRLAL